MIVSEASLVPDLKAAKEFFAELDQIYLAAICQEALRFRAASSRTSAASLALDGR